MSFPVFSLIFLKYYAPFKSKFAELIANIPSTNSQTPPQHFTNYSKIIIITNMQGESTTLVILCCVNFKPIESVIWIFTLKLPPCAYPHNGSDTGILLIAASCSNPSVWVMHILLVWGDPCSSLLPLHDPVWLNSLSVDNKKKKKKKKIH